MEEYFSVLRGCWLFRGLSEQELRAVLGCITARRKLVEKQQILFHAGDTVPQAGIVLRGRLHIFREDFWGNQTILASIEPGDLFGEVYACLSGTPADVSARAVQQTDILFLDMDHLLAACPSGCAFHARILSNFIGVLAQKNRMLNQKIHHLTQRTLRSKVLSYLSQQSALAGQSTFCIPYNRQQLADYLSVDRSALSAELGRLRDEGVLRFRKNTFTLLEHEPL